jgi:hypothetical protein
MAEPQNATIPGASLGYNCRLSVRGYGSRLVRVESLAFPMEIITSEAAGTIGRVMYPLQIELPGFSLDVVFITRQERDGFNDWVSGYMRRVATNQHIGGYFYVVVPARRFAQSGVPIGPLPHGDRVGMLGYRMTIQFVGAQQPLSAVGYNTDHGVSYYKPPTADQAQARYFYPSGTQLSGREDLEGTLYDPTPAQSGSVGEPTNVVGSRDRRAI